MKNIKTFIKFLFGIYIKILGTLIILQNFKKIKDVDRIYFNNWGSFGHTISMSDVIRITEKGNNILLIICFEEERFNKYIHLLYDYPIIYVPVYKKFKFFNMSFFAGEYYPRKFSKFYYSLIKKINENIIATKVFWREISRANYPNFFKLKTENQYHLKWKLSWFKLSLNSNPFFLPERINKELLSKLDETKKICTIYRRNRPQFKQDIVGYVRNTPVKLYLDVINLLNEHNYQILIYGDWSDEDLHYIQTKYKIINYRTLKIDKKLFDIFAATNCELLIGSEGGGQCLYHYCKNKIHINHYPYGSFPFPHIDELKKEKLSENEKQKIIKNFLKKNILYKKVFFKNNKLSTEECFDKLWGKFYLSNDFQIKDNTSDEVINFISDHIKKN